MAQRHLAALLLLLLLLLLPFGSSSWLSSLLGSSSDAKANPPAASASSSAASQDKNALFLDWFKSNGGYVHPSIELKFFPLYGRGLSAVGDVDHLDVLFTAPPSIILTPESVANLYPSPLAEDLAKVKNDNYAIALQLCVECALGEDSRFRPYLDVLPGHVSNLETFTEEQVRRPKARREAPKMYRYNIYLYLLLLERLLTPWSAVGHAAVSEPEGDRQADAGRYDSSVRRHVAHPQVDGVPHGLVIRGAGP